MILNVEKNNKRIKVLENRVNNIMALPDGSTNADAELKDIRVGADGELYSTAGEAVRKQFDSANSNIDAIDNQVNGKSVTKEYAEWVTGEIDSSTGELITEGVYKQSTGYIKLSAGDSITLTEVPESSKLKVYSYDVETKFFNGLVATLYEYGIRTFTTTEDMLVRCSDDGSGTFRLNVTTVSDSLVKDILTLTDQLNKTTEKADEAYNKSSLLNSQVNISIRTTSEPEEWVEGAINETDGLVYESSEGEKTTGFLTLTTLQTLKASGGTVHVYEYNTVTQAYTSKLMDLEDNGMELSVFRDSLVRVTVPADATVIITTSGDSLMKKVETLEGEVEELRNMPSSSGLSVTSSYRLSAKGWYRIAKYKASGINMARGGGCNSVDIVLKRTFSTTSNEYHHIELASIYNNANFYNIRKLVNRQLLGKIRLVVDVNTNTAYIELYYSSDDGNTLTCILNNIRDSSYSWEVFSAPELTEESVTDVITLCSLDL